MTTTTGEIHIRTTFLRVQVLGEVQVVRMEDQVAAPLLLQADQAWPKKHSPVNALIKVDMIFMAFHVLLAGQRGVTRRDGGLSEGLGRCHKRQSRKLSSGSVSFFTESK